MNKVFSRWSAICLALLLMIVLATQSVVAVVPASTVSMEPPTKVVGIGDTFQVNIYTTPGVPIAGVQARLSFDPTVLQANNVVEGTFLSQSGHPVYFSPGDIDNTAGTITRVFGVIAAPGVAVSTPATFATVTFTAVAEGAVLLTLSNVVLGNLQAQATPTSMVNGAITVYPDWDVNLDGSHNVLDMVSVYQHFPDTGTPHWIREDVNRDGAINVLDMILVGQHWTG